MAAAGLLVAASAACGAETPSRTGDAAPAPPPQAPAATSGATAKTGAKATPKARTTSRPSATKRPAPRPKPKVPAPRTTRPPKVATPAPLRASGAWKRAFNGSAGSIGCEQSFAQLKASGTPRLTFGRTTVFVGFQQYGNNQDPVFARYDGTREVYCEHHEKQSPDGRALGVTWDGGPTAYVVYTVVGGGTELEVKAARGWLNRYGDGGASSAVTVVGQVELRGGTLTRSTFLVARRVKNGQTKTNTIVPVAAPLRTASGGVAIFAKSAFAPLNPDQSQMCPSGKGEYPQSGPGRADGASFVGVFVSNLGSLSCAKTWGCSNVRKPCPDIS
jgi:hypothetical protein